MPLIYTGPMPPGMREVMVKARIGFSLQSNFARERSLAVALGASNGWLTTVSSSGKEYSSWWSITQAGLTMLENLLHEQTPPLRISFEGAREQAKKELATLAETVRLRAEERKRRG